MSGDWPRGDPQLVVRGILADPRFRGTTASGPPQPSLIDRILTWIGTQIGALIRAIGHLLGARTPANDVLAIAVVAAAAAVLVVCVVRFLRLPGRRHAAPRPVSTALDPQRTSAALLALAVAAAREERWHDAASALVQAALRALDERGRLRFDASRTASEARRVLRDPAFDTFAREATTTLFAAGGATPERFARLRAAYDATFAEPRA